MTSERDNFSRQHLSVQLHNSGHDNGSHLHWGDTRALKMSQLHKASSEGAGARARVEDTREG